MTPALYERSASQLRNQEPDGKGNDPGPVNDGSSGSLWDRVHWRVVPRCLFCGRSTCRPLRGSASRGASAQPATRCGHGPQLWGKIEAGATE